jgi:MOSC domain-containing protein YiiM
MPKKTSGRVVSVHAGCGDNMSKEERAAIQVELDGIVADHHRSYVRQTWAGDKQPKGTTRRNERQWSAVSVEELEKISSDMNLVEMLTPTELGANLCLQGIDNLSCLPKGSILKFPSGAVLVVEEYNPPCHDMGKKIAISHTTLSGTAIASTAFSKAAKLTRGIVGVVEVAGSISAGDKVVVEKYTSPW